MDHYQYHQDEDLSNSASFQLMKNTSINNFSSWLEIRLFYVRIAPCALSSVPDHLTLCHMRREMGVSLEINGARVPTSELASVTLRRDRLNKESSEVTYVSTDSVRVSGGVEFEVLADNEEMVLCGSLERIEGTACWGNDNGGGGGSGDNKTGWSMDCFVAAGSARFGQSSIEIYVAGCCGTVPVILTKTIQASSRRKASRQTVLDAIPEDEEVWKDHKSDQNGLIRQRKLQDTESEVEGYDVDGKFGNRYYSEEAYYGEDGQLSWFNAGVRVGVGIGLGMCLGVGIGVGLLMRSYQTTTRNLRRRFL
ncbi:uncharacterized protein At1g01500-like [Rutidosis leptorrhynchoides]|uniref:uncharacterized protein At1g01500-like n=1 Tax=Rutidosis leptorrhynchoides TaxID=125765 RepID=UPI003A99989E